MREEFRNELHAGRNPSLIAAALRTEFASLRVSAKPRSRKGKPLTLPRTMAAAKLSHTRGRAIVLLVSGVSEQALQDLRRRGYGRTTQSIVMRALAHVAGLADR